MGRDSCPTSTIHSRNDMVCKNIMVKRLDAMIERD